MKFIDGQIIYNENKFVLFPINVWVLLEFELIKENNIKILIENELKAIVSKLFENLNEKNLNTIIELLNNLGFGIISKLYINNKKNCEILFKCENSQIMKIYFKYFKKNRIKSNFILEQLLKYFLIKIYKKNVSSKIIIKNSIIYLKFKIEKNENKLISNIKNNKYELNESELNSIIKRVLINKQLNCENGNIKLWNVNMVLLPKAIFNLNFENKIINEKIFKIGIAQGIGAKELLNKVYGKKNNKEVIMHLSSQSELLGFGKILIIKNDCFKKTLKLLFTKDFFKNDKLNFLGIYCVGLTTGVLEAIYLQKFKYKIKTNFILFYSNNKKIKYNLFQIKTIKKLNLDSKIN